MTAARLPRTTPASCPTRSTRRSATTPRSASTVRCSCCNSRATRCRTWASAPRRLAAGGDRRLVPAVEPRSAHRPGATAATSSSRSRSEVDRVARAGEPPLSADDRHRSLQARQRRPRPPGRRPGAEGGRRRARRMHPADGHGGAVRRRGVRDRSCRTARRRTGRPSPSEIRAHVGSRSDRDRRAATRSR